MIFRNLLAAYIAAMSQQARQAQPFATTIVRASIPIGVRFALNCPLPKGPEIKAF